MCIIKAKKSNDSVGGTVTCVIRNVPSGLGEPCFDKLEAKLAHAMFSIPLPKDLRLEVASKWLALVVMDALMIQQSRKTAASLLPQILNIPVTMLGVVPIKSYNETTENKDS
ncbi:16690_t:CDS:2 [Entrophospora sp. SA101]|nr:16690_t:CDS:2 [Entrophospora sp. SA101]